MLAVKLSNVNSMVSKPIAKHKQDGTFRDDRHLPDTPPDGTADMEVIDNFPAGLNERCRQDWQLICGEMFLARTLNPGDILLIESLCINLDMQRECYKYLQSGELFERMVNTKGAEYIQTNPAINALSSINKTIIDLCNQLGLSPLARTKIGVSKSDKKDVFKDDL